MDVWACCCGWGSRLNAKLDNQDSRKVRGCLYDDKPNCLTHRFSAFSIHDLGQMVFPFCAED